ncbi:DUF1811 family protein [Shimazuella kribbensis]|uniref:DUF1811 family protein n=1 Tax=Shimazuella kribbensis TaxID=139808 RepID=UPI0004157718|nr:DUF1811 family protein [Shimazuella kribbensis]
MKRYSQMIPEEIRNTIKELEEQLSQVEKEKLDSQAAILRQKIILGKSYLVNPNEIKVEATYQVEGTPVLFQVSYLNGVYAWGTFEGKSEKEAVPLSLLKITRN